MRLRVGGRKRCVISKLGISYISWELITLVIRLITFRDDNIRLITFRADASPGRKGMLQRNVGCLFQLHFLKSTTVDVGVAGETWPCNFHPSGWLRARALTCRRISLVGVKWSRLRTNRQAFPPKKVDVRLPEERKIKFPWREAGPP